MLTKQGKLCHLPGGLFGPREDHVERQPIYSEEQLKGKGEIGFGRKQIIRKKELREIGQRTETENKETKRVIKENILTGG